jgi:hypothetical protein
MLAESASRIGLAAPLGDPGVVVAALAALIGVPHWAQNRALELSSAPHDGQPPGSGAPHAEQNLASGPLSTPHARQRTPT